MTRESFTVKGLRFHWIERNARYESELHLEPAMLSKLVLSEFEGAWYGSASLVRGPMQNTREAALVCLLVAIREHCEEHTRVITHILAAP